MPFAIYTEVPARVASACVQIRAAGEWIRHLAVQLIFDQREINL